jgi:hypothetical protein
LGLTRQKSKILENRSTKDKLSRSWEFLIANDEGKNRSLEYDVEMISDLVFLQHPNTMGPRASR